MTDLNASATALRHEVLLAQATAVRERLLAFDQFAVGKIVGLTPRVRSVLGLNMQDFARRHDKGPWLAAAEALRADPMASVSIALPEAVAPVPRAVSHSAGEVVRAVPLLDEDDPITEEVEETQ